MKKTIGFIAIMGLAACGPKSKSTPTTIGQETPAATEFGYDALFEQGRTWTFTLHTLDDDGEEKSEDTVDATCTVQSVVNTADGGRASWIDCPDFAGMNGDPLSGLWVDGAKGAYHVGAVEMIADGTSTAQDEVPDSLIFGKPIADRHEEQRDPEYGDDPIAETSVSREGDTWCWSQSYTMGDESWSTLCIDANGPTKGTFGWAGGSVHEAEITLKK